MHGLMIIALCTSLATGGYYLANAVSTKDLDSKSANTSEAFIEALHACHTAQPEHTMIFALPLDTAATRYGATTGMKAAIMPRNFSRMNESEQQAFLAYLAPYTLVDTSYDTRTCSAHE